MLPPPELLAEIVECIDHRFVAKGHWEEALQGPLPHTPSRAVESLPWDLGGLQRADIPAQVYALQAKVAAMLLHPRRHAWKTLLRRAFQRYHTVWDPGGGEAGAELLAHLRLLFCRAVWYLRCCRVAHGQVFSASAVSGGSDFFLALAGYQA
jgi:hypothetical protein